jgi:hypothetical protein
MAVKINLPTIKDRIKKLKNFSKILAAVAVTARGDIVKNWLQARGADGKPFNPLTPSYLKYKVGKRSRLPLRNLHLSGRMAGALHVKPGKNKAIIGWSDTDNLDKARGNYNHAKNMMSVGPVIETRAVITAFKLFTR